MIAQIPDMVALCSTCGTPVQIVKMVPREEYEAQLQKLAKKAIKANDLQELKRLHRGFKIDLSSDELGFKSVGKPDILRYICKHSGFLDGQRDALVLYEAVRAKSLESVRYLEKEQGIDPKVLRSYFGGWEEYQELVSNSNS